MARTTAPFLHGKFGSLLDKMSNQAAVMLNPSGEGSQQMSEAQLIQAMKRLKLLYIKARPTPFLIFNSALKLQPDHLRLTSLYRHDCYEKQFPRCLIL